MSTETKIQFPQSPFVDPGTGRLSDEWMQWLLNPQFITVNIGSVLAVGSGGTGIASYTTGDILFASASDELDTLADVATGKALISGGVGVAPAWGKIGLTTHVTGTLAIANGGTGMGSYTTGDLIVASAADTLDTIADVATGNALISGGVGAEPAWGKVGLTTHVSGTLPVANGGTGSTGARSSFTPTRSGWTDVGSPTVTGNYTPISNIVFFEVKVVPGTTCATTAGTSYVELPVAAAGFGGDAVMVNATTNIAVGDCSIDAANSRVYVPSQVATGNTLIVSGWYFSA